MISTFAYQASETLGFMSLMAMLVAVWRLATLRDAVGMVGPASAFDMTIRRMFLLGFALYMGGSVMREAVVLWAGVYQWDDTAVLLSASSRLVQVLGACVYVRGATVTLCGEKAWMTVLGASMFFAVVNPV